MCWCTSMIKNTIGGILDGLVLLFGGVLVLLVRFTLPTVNTNGTKDIFNLVTSKSLTSVTKKAIGSTSLNNVIFESVRELVVLLNIMYVSYFGGEVPTKITAAVDPSKIAGTSEYTISHATSSLRL
jgi:hypothetical protein